MRYEPDDPSDTPLDIVLIEDDDGDAKAIRRALDRAGISNPVCRVVDGVEGLALLRGELRAPPRRYVVLLDLNMPRMNGLEFLEELRADPRLRRAIVFVVTTSSDERDLARSYDRNIAGYVVKSRLGRDFRDLVGTLDTYRRLVLLPDMAGARHDADAG